MNIQKLSKERIWHNRDCSQDKTAEISRLFLEQLGAGTNIGSESSTKVRMKQ